MDDKSLLKLISDNNRVSFDLFYNLYYEQVFRFAYSLLKDKDACREVVTDVFFSIWQSRKHLKDVNNIETYLYIIVRNEANRYLSKRNNSSYIPIDELSVQIKDHTGSSPEDMLLNEEIEKLLTQVINELPEKCRIIFLMAREEGLKPKQIAEILSITESTVRVQMKLAIEKIVNSIKPHFPNITFSLLISILFKFF